jgi:HNH endonuclease
MNYERKFSMEMTPFDDDLSKFELFSNCPLHMIKKSKRMGWLKKQLKQGKWLSKFERDYYRKEFDKIKDILINFKVKTACYVCSKEAKHRHHVVPLAKGGKNDLSNIVPLCIKCHAQLAVVFPVKRKQQEIGMPKYNPVWHTKNFVSPLSNRTDVVVVPPVKSVVQEKGGHIQ